MNGIFVQFSGVDAVLDEAGALWLPASGALVVSDLHLEKASSFARRGMCLPPYDSLATLRLLAQVIERRRPRTVVALGDSFHDRGGGDRLGEAERALLAGMQRGRSWLWILGNHDPEPPAGLGGEALAEAELEGLRFRHLPTPGSREAEIAGHLHPAAKIVRQGRSVRRRAFVGDGVRMVLPAFGVLAGGLNVLDRAFADLFPTERFLAFMLGEQRVYPVGRSALSPD